MSHFAVMHVGGRQRRRHNHARPADADMSSQTIKGLSGDFVIAIGSQTGENAAAISLGKATDRHGKAVHHRDQRIMRNELAQMGKQLLFDHPLKIALLLPHHF